MEGKKRREGGAAGAPWWGRVARLRGPAGGLARLTAGKCWLHKPQHPCDNAGAGRHYQNPVAERRWLPSPSVCRQAGENGGLAPPVHTRIDRRQHSATTH